MDVQNPQGSGQNPQAGGENPNQQTGKTIEQLDAERRTAISEAIKNSQEAAAAKKEAEYQKELNRVLRNPQEIMSINENNPELADKIAREAFGKSFSELLNAAQGNDANYANAEAIARKVVQEEKQRENRKQMEQSIDKFYVDNGILPGTPVYVDMQREFRNYSPANLDAAISILGMLRDKYTARNDNGSKANPPSANHNNMPQPAAKSTGYQKINDGKKAPPTHEQKSIMPKFGLTDADWEKYAR